jgi:hypothetical protein
MKDMEYIQKKMPDAFIKAFKNNNDNPPKYIYKVIGGLKKYEKPRHSTLYIDLKYPSKESRFFKKLTDAKRFEKKISGVRAKAKTIKYVLE